MFIITITVSDALSPEQHHSLFPGHMQWFQHHFSTGAFVVVGPYIDRERSGVIMANTESRDALMAILVEDPYYPDLATYDIREFVPAMVAENLHQLEQS
ncbi:YciI family protein [Yersinia artesiana]|uniref:YciI family protein n=1 Tax=Yersinia artesiana TaxID=2890315 RepID=UPI001581EABA|nr:YciI family protein [Yersinia artesiana]